MSASSFSGGPDTAADGEEPILSHPDVGTPEERLTSMVEHCLAWGGEQRLRLQITLSTSGGAVLLLGLCRKPAGAPTHAAYPP